MDEITITHTPTITHVLKAARPERSRLLADKFNRTAENPNVISNWKRIMMLAQAILPASGAFKSNNPQSCANSVMDRIKRWRAGKLMELWKEAKA